MLPAVKESLGKYECHHRSKEFGDILVSVLQRLPQIFQTTQPCYVLSATGTGGLEAAIVNTLSTDRKALFINAGKFGERWGKIAKTFGIPFDEIVIPWGEDVDLNQVEDFLKKESYQALAWQACETSTGALLPTQALAKLCQTYDCLSVVDAITALGAAPLPMDNWRLDVVVGGSQKAFMIPTGMAFVALSEKAQNCESDIKSYYFNLKAERKANEGGKTRYSTPTQMIIALDLVFDEILGQGLPNYLQSIAERAEYFRKNVSLPLFPKVASPSLSCLQVPAGLTATALKNKVYDEGIMIVAGQDRIKDQVIRIGHMGAMTLEDLKQTAQAIEKHL